MPIKIESKTTFQNSAGITIGIVTSNSPNLEYLVRLYEPISKLEGKDP